MTRTALGALPLAGVYGLALASADPVDLVTGYLLAVAALAALRGWVRIPSQTGAGGLAARALAFPAFAAAVLVDVVRGTWDVALRVLHLRPLERPGIVLVPIGERSELGVAVTALVMTLSPGTVLLDVERSRGVMLIHVIDASDGDAVRAQMQRFYERWQRRVFP